MVLFSCNKENKIKIYPLNPPSKEYFSGSSFPDSNAKKCRIDLYGIEGLRERNQKYYDKVDSLINQLGQENKDKFSIYSIEFYTINDVIRKDNYLNYSDLRYGVGKQYTLAWAVFKNGKIEYLHFVENGNEVYDFLLKKEIDEIYE